MHVNFTSRDMESSLLREILVPSLHAFVRLLDVSFLGSIRLFKMSMQALEQPYWHEDGGRRGWKVFGMGLTGCAHRLAFGSV